MPVIGMCVDRASWEICTVYTYTCGLGLRPDSILKQYLNMSNVTMLISCLFCFSLKSSISSINKTIVSLQIQ